MKIIADFETANTAGVSLDEYGPERYASDPATEVLCLCVIDADTRELLVTWKPGDPIDELARPANDQTVVWEAHNASFEQMIWQHIMVPQYGLPVLPHWRWACSMAAALWRGCPAGLKPLALALGATEQKDMEGNKLTLSLSRPMTKVAWGELCPEGETKAAWLRTYVEQFDRSPATIQRVIDYCVQDCRTEAEVSGVVGGLSAYERGVWLHDQIINQRGVKIDIPYVAAMAKVVDDAKADVLRRFQALTGLNPNQVARVREWCAEHGVDLPDLTAGRIDGLLGGSDAETGVVQGSSGLPPLVHEVLSLRRLLGAKAVEKLPRMLQWAGEGDRCRYLLQYHGAGPGRWAGRGWQPHNLPRMSVPGRTPEQVVEAFMTRDHRQVRERLDMDPIVAAGLSLRHAMIPEDGRVFCAADFAGIEMRVLLALAGQRDKCELLRLGDTGERPVDVYLDMAEKIYGVEPGTWTPPDAEALKTIKTERSAERQIGKNTVLGCGFQMGKDKFHERYCPHMPAEFAGRVIAAYRNEWAPKVPELWEDLGSASADAVCSGRARVARCGVEFRPEDDWLSMLLPDGQIMWYRDPQYAGEDFRGNPTWTYRAWKDGQWKVVHAYGGLQTENVVQRLARGLLVSAMRRLEDAGYPVVMTIHDEIISEPYTGRADQKEFERIMAEPPAWAKSLGVPIAVEGWTGRRGRK